MSQGPSRLEDRARTAAATDVSDVYVYRTNVVRVASTSELADGVFVDFDDDGNVVGVEVIDAVRTVVTNRLVFEPDPDL